MVCGSVYGVNESVCNLRNCMEYDLYVHFMKVSALSMKVCGLSMKVCVLSMKVFVFINFYVLSISIIHWISSTEA